MKSKELVKFTVVALLTTLVVILGAASKGSGGSTIVVTKGFFGRTKERPFPNREMAEQWARIEAQKFTVRRISLVTLN